MKQSRKRVPPKALPFTALVLVAAVLFFIANLMYNAGSFKTIKPHFDGTEKRVPISPGAEDMTLDHSTGIVYIACFDRRDWFNGNPMKKNGRIYKCNLKTKMPRLEELKVDLKHPFHPHGISLFKTEKGRDLLFVVNHAEKDTKELVEIFEIHHNKLVHLESIKDSLITSPNDVVAVGERRFYVSNDHGYTSGFWKSVEDYMQLGISYVNYYDGKKVRTVAKDIQYANGINVSKDGEHLFVASVTGKKILVYQRNSLNGELTKIDEIFADTGVDNIEVEQDGSLLVGCHPQMLAFLAHARNSSNKSPSQVLKINWKPETKTKIEEIYLNDGNILSGSTVAVSYGKNILIGSVFEPFILWCERTNTTKK